MIAALVAACFGAVALVRSPEVLVMISTDVVETLRGDCPLLAAGAGAIECDDYRISYSDQGNLSSVTSAAGIVTTGHAGRSSMPTSSGAASAQRARHIDGWVKSDGRELRRTSPLEIHRGPFHDLRPQAA